MSGGVRRLVAVNRFYWPDHSATSQILTDLCERAVAEGWEVVVIASRMRYDAPKARLAARETCGGVRVVRVRTTRMGRDFAPARALDYASFYVAAFVALLWIARRGDVVLAKTDPPLISVPAWIAARLKGARLVNWLQDVFPEVAGALGMEWARGPAGALLRRFRNRSLDGADANVVISDRMAETLAAEGVRAESLSIVQNWSCERIRPAHDAENGLRRAWGLEGRFVVGYSGNLGRAHAATAVAELVRRTARIDGLSWLFVGGGAGLAAVRAAALKSGANARFEPYQPRDLLSESLSVPDMHLVSLDPACEGLIMPSKLYGVMAAGRGVIALGDPDGAVAREVQRGDFGVALDMDDPDSWAPAISAAMADGVAGDFGARAAARFALEHGAGRMLDQWMAVLRSVDQPTDGAADALGRAA